jgi:hypothetical protein
MRAMTIISRLSAVAITLLLGFLNIRLYHPIGGSYGPDRLGPDIIPQLRFLGDSLRTGGGGHMQSVFPEGFFFSHVLYGLTWVDVGLRESHGTPLYDQAVQEAGWALEQLDGAEGRAPFSEGLNPAYGVFYAGWTSRLRGGFLMIQSAEERSTAEVERFQLDCAALASAFNRSDTPFLSSYPGQAWPVDSVVAVAALRLHDHLFSPLFGGTIDRWLNMAWERLDPATGLLPHRVDPKTGYWIEGARGSSQSLIARFLIEVDPNKGRAQYALFRKQFITPFLGVPGVREYPAGAGGFGDVDSGPLLFGFSASATIVAIGAAQVQGDLETASAMISASEAVGLPIEWGGRKFYALGLIPVGDAFLAWAKASRLWITPMADAGLPSLVAGRWRLPFHFASFIMAAFLWSRLIRKGKVVEQTDGSQRLKK